MQLRLLSSFAFAAILIGSCADARPASHNSGLANGKTCNMSTQCRSQYCHHGSCDVKKANGHVCYKDVGCVSGYCHHGKCDVKKPDGHVCYTNTGCLSGLCSNKTCHSTATSSPHGHSSVSPSVPASTSTSTSTASNGAGATTTITTSSTPSSTSPTSTPSSSSTPSPSSTPSTTLPHSSSSSSSSSTTPNTPAATAGNSGQLYYLADYFKQTGADEGVIEENADGVTAAGDEEVWSLTSDKYLKGENSGNILTTDGLRVYTRPSTDADNGFPYLCMQGESTDISPAGPGNYLTCVADSGTKQYSTFFICTDGQIAADLTSCTDKDTNYQRTIQELILSNTGEDLPQ